MEASPFCSATLLPENAKAKNKGTEWLYFRMTYCLARLRLRYRRRSTRTRQGTGGGRMDNLGVLSCGRRDVKGAILRT